MRIIATKYNDELIARCRRGDGHAQMQVYDKYYKAMYNTAVRIVGHTAEAEDVMQESFLKAFSKIDSFKGKATFGAWLKRIVINESIKALEKRKKQNETEYPYGLQEEKTEDNFENIDETTIRAQQILKMMQGLKENYKITLNLHLIEGYDYEEISEILNISNANCRTTISRAKEQLRKKMMPYEK